ncbi:MAG: PspC domain-containing protein [Alistipes sp.]|nr:PspC domain-containing protein [Alistipes sp.]
MKETVTVNIASQAFTLDTDARDLLGSYLDEIRMRLPEGDTETLGDIEARIAEIFRERAASPMTVVSIADVRSAMNRMGRPEDFGEPRKTAGTHRSETDETLPRRLYRSRSNRSIAGLCGGMAKYLNADATMLRLLTLFLILVGGLSVWVYIILWIVIPEEPAKTINVNRQTL